MLATVKAPETVAVPIAVGLLIVVVPPESVAEEKVPALVLFRVTEPAADTQAAGLEEARAVGRGERGL